MSSWVMAEEVARVMVAPWALASLMVLKAVLRIQRCTNRVSAATESAALAEITIAVRRAGKGTQRG